MSSLEGTIPSLLQGVSQQIPRERKDGQLGAQFNMLSDPVTGIRRRPPAMLLNDATGIAAPNTGNLFTAYVERGTDGRHLVINTTTGQWWLLAKNTGAVVSSGTNSYLQASIGAVSIQTASISGLTYILNTEKTPVTTVSNTGKLNPSTTGFFRLLTTVLAAKEWNITVSHSGSSTPISATYTIPGDNAEPEQATASFITNALVNGSTADGNNTVGISAAVVAAGGTVSRDASGTTIFISGLANCVVTTSSGSTYASVSNQSRVNQESDLPASLPASANGMMMAVGQAGKDTTWYQFNYSTRSWVETGGYGSISSITNMPLELAADDNIIARTFEGRLAGDDDTNASPYFIDNGYITGIAAFQGRLVILSGAGISMSASGLYTRFYRSTVTSLLDTDRIDIASASAQDSVFRNALQFNRDLVVFGDSMQAVVPGSGALTPSNASVSLTSEFSADSRVSPIVAGQTVLYPNRRNADYAGILEFVPSPYTASQYTSTDAAVHLPRYIPGRIMKMSLSSVTNIGFIQYSGETKSLLVHEYLWDTEGKKQAAWHKWTFQQEILSVHSQSEVMYLFTRNPSTGIVQIQTIDPRAGFVADGVYDIPYMDAQVNVVVSGGKFTVPANLQGGAHATDLLLTYPSSSDLSGDVVGVASYADTVGTVSRGVPDGTYSVGFRIPSSFTITPPILKDGNGNIVGSGHVRLIRLDAAARKSGNFDVAVLDSSRSISNSGEYSGLIMNSSELSPDLAPRFDLGNIIIPCRTNSDTTEVTFSTDLALEMNILDISYILKYNQRRSRV